MLPRTAHRLPVDEAHLVDPTWGGLRVLASAFGHRVGLYVEGRDVADRFPDLVASLGSLDLPGALLDGEIVVPGVRGRALVGAIGRPGPAIRPATLVVFDLPWLAGHVLIAESLVRRRDRLAELAIRAPHVVAVDPAFGTTAVLQVVVLHGLVGVIAKRADSPYLPGVRSRLWRLVRVADIKAAPPEPQGRPLSHALDHVTNWPPGVATDDTGKRSRRRRSDIALLRKLPLGEDT
jgi:bifunctional non-homologous end joining protein LigD